MSEAKFTKGPLVAVVDGSGSWCVEFDCGPWRDGEYLSFSTTSASNDDDEDICTGATARANAHLIAAAPEMYKEIEREYSALLYEIQNCINIEKVKILKAVAERKSRILAKARGEK